MNVKRLEIGVELALLIGGIVYVYVMLSYPSRAGIVPAIVAAVMLTALVGQIVRRVLRTRAAAAGAPAHADQKEADAEFQGLLGDGGMDGAARRRLVTIVTWSVLLLVLLQTMGFVAGIGAGILLFMLLDRQPIGLTLAVSAGMTLGVYVLAEFILGIRWEKAPLFELVRSLL